MKFLTPVVITLLALSLTFCDSKGKKQDKTKSKVFEPTEKPSDSIGLASHGKKVFYIREAVAVYEPTKKYLSIHIFPFKLTDKDMENIVKKNSSFGVKKGKPSPNKSIWPSWSPYGKIRIAFDKESDKIDIANAKSGYFYLGGMKSANSSDNNNVSKKKISQALKTFKGELKEGGKLELDLDFNSMYFKKKFVVKLKLNTTIYILKK